MIVLYLHGFASGPGSKKAQFFKTRLEDCGVPAVVPDLAEGDFEHLTISRQLDVVSRAAAGRAVTVIGSSMGGYLAALYAARHPEVERLILLAPAFCFATRWPETLGDAAMANWRNTGWRTVFHYGEGRERALSYKLIEDGLQFEGYPEVRQPTLVLHGTRDDVVPAALSREFARTRPNVRLVLVESGHELTDVTDVLWRETMDFLGLSDDSVTNPPARMTDGL